MDVAVRERLRPHPSLAISPRSIAMRLPTIFPARDSRTGKQAGAVLCGTAPFNSSGRKGFGRVRVLWSERRGPDGCHGWRMPSACREKGPKAMAARGSDTGINYD